MDPVEPRESETRDADNEHEDVSNESIHKSDTVDQEGHTSSSPSSFVVNVGIYLEEKRFHGCPKGCDRTIRADWR